MDVTGKGPVCFVHTFPSYITASNKILFSTFMGSTVIGTCLDPVFLIAWFNWPCTMATFLVNIYALALMLILAITEESILNYLY